MPTRKRAIGFLAIVAPILLGSLVPGPARTNPEVDTWHTFETVLTPPDDIRALMRNACYDCHSNETRWPWYSRVAPGSWLVAHDVRQGRKTMNFSEWSDGPGRKPEIAGSMLLAACAAVEQGEMPPAQYRAMHPEARLSKAEVQRFCQWSSAKSSELFGMRAKP